MHEKLGVSKVGILGEHGTPPDRRCTQASSSRGKHFTYTSPLGPDCVALAHRTAVFISGQRDEASGSAKDNAEEVLDCTKSPPRSPRRCPLAARPWSSPASWPRAWRT